MPILAGFTVPHPPILIPGVGRGEERGAQSTLDSFAEVGRRIAELAPELVVMTTSHGRLYRDVLCVSSGTSARGDFSNFNCRDEVIDVQYDQEFVAALLDEAHAAGTSGRAPGGTLSGTVSDDLPGLPLIPTAPGETLDHGCLVPLHFILSAQPPAFKLARIQISFADEATHFAVGQAIARTVQQLGRRAVFVASGDCSHRLKTDGPYGFNPAGPVMDELICTALANGDFEPLMQVDPILREDAGECGLNSFLILAGALAEQTRLNGAPFSAQLLSYEGPWGVGYAVAEFAAIANQGPAA
ncbi:MAG: hypothetical protein LBR39_03030 [Coriobacteriales bacterium]|jgi:aromatic ring-opening dioxygenase LigB subunit|nr:hypothetical protein [Coriobacteriales bacterium]